MKKILAFSLAASLLLPSSALASETIKINHKVKNGDSLWKISQSHQTSVSSIKSLNGLSSTEIYPGQNLLINTKSVINHKVGKGDTLWKISNTYGALLHEVIEVNNLSTTYIYPGQVLKIPVTKKAQTSKYSQAEIDLLAKLVRAEAIGEPYAGKVAVAAVVLNRVEDTNFPNSISGVIYETYENGKFYAFSPVQNGEIYKQADESSYKAVYEAINGSDPTNGSIYFYNPKTSTSTWIKSTTVTTQIGNHVFAK